MRVVCTAGHVDHGKSSLVRALTGMEPDRFEEERRRGLTIDLGFAWTDVGEHVVAFVDLPGHERFIANMLAGAGPVETALFVVAGDEGWKPQSQEHLDILVLLGVSRGVVALTKADLLDAPSRQAAADDVRARLAGTPLAGSAVVACSAVSGEGLDPLRATLAGLLDRAPAPADDGRPRLWVDRRFTVKGAGTVVTGTLTGGALSVGDELTLLPGDRRGRVRGLQSLGAAVQRAVPGSRVAVNLSGLERTEVERGDALVRPGDWLECAALEAWVRVLPGQELGRRGAWHLHAGSARRDVTVIPVSGKPVTGEGAVRLELDAPLALAAGDRFVLREAGRWTTVAGGVALDVAPRPPVRGAHRDARAAELRARLEALGDRAALLGLHVRERAAAPVRDATAAVGLAGSDARAAASAQRLLPLGDSLVHAAAASQWSEAALHALRGYHAAHPLERAAPKNVAVRALCEAGCPATLAGAFLDALARLGRVTADGPGVRDPGHQVALDEKQSAARDALLGLLRAELFSPPGLAEAMSVAGADEALVKELERSGVVLRLGPDIALVEEAIGEAVARLRAAFPERPFTAGDARQAWGTTRKFAVPLLEELDRRRLTVRSGDLRTLAKTR